MSKQTVRASPKSPADYLHRFNFETQVAVEQLLTQFPTLKSDDLTALLRTNAQEGPEGAANNEADHNEPVTETGKYVYFFAANESDGRASMKGLLGGKGANLAEMARLGCPVPPGFTISTEVCKYYSDHHAEYPASLTSQVESSISRLEKLSGKKFGDGEDPLLLSVRSGAAISMPGMMDTILNLGLTDEAVRGLAQKSGNPRWAWDSYRRFIQMFGGVAMGVDGDLFEHALTSKRKEAGVQHDNELTEKHLEELVGDYKRIYQEAVGEPLPQDPQDQLWKGITAVFKSWNNSRAIKYRELNEITGLLGTAVNVQTMVFGNYGETSATGVCFSRNPSNGDNHFYGEWLVNAQGEDVVAGIRTPQQIRQSASQDWAQQMGIAEGERAKSFPSLEERMPPLYKELCDIRLLLENHYTDMQDMEFTIQENKLYMLQTRNGKRTALAAVKCAVEMVAEGLINEAEAIRRVNPKQLDQLLHPMIEPGIKTERLARGLPASPGAAVGTVCFTAADAEKYAGEGKKVILVRVETSPEDISGMNSAEGILTARGGMTSHAAVVARGMGKPCVAGCGELQVDAGAKTLTIGTIVFKEGDFITLNGTTGDVCEGKLPLRAPEMEGEFKTLMEFCQRAAKLGVRTNADTPQDAAQAIKFGAAGIGLCRTEHMFFEADRIEAVRQMILAVDEDAKKKALDKVFPYQKSDFKALFKIMEHRPITVRLLDPPLHEFLPHKESEIAQLAISVGLPLDEVKTQLASMQEANPMLGHRGCRLGITHPWIYDMQVRAIFEAAVEVLAEGVNIAPPEIMIPLVGKRKEFSLLKKRTQGIAQEVLSKAGKSLRYRVGTMIEVPRAALTADELVQDGAEFFSFGTNDLTQMTCGFSRDDAGSFLVDYVAQGIYDKDPFAVLDQGGVGKLVEMAVSKGRSVSRGLKCGICGEHGGDPTTVAFCHSVGLDYVSCSPYRVPVALLAAAQAAV